MMNPDNLPQNPLPPTQQAQQPGPPSGAFPTPTSMPSAAPNAASPTAQNPYDFIVNPTTPPKKSGFSGGGNSMRLLLLVGGGALIVVILGVIFASVFSKGGNTASLTSLAQEQQELIRVAALGEQQATSESTKALAYTVDLGVGTSQTQLLTYLSAHGVKVKAAQLSLAKDASTDKQLADAQATGTYDSALQKILAAQLQAYISSLQKAYKSAQTAQLKQLISTDFTTAKLLLVQAQGDSTTNQ